MAGILLGVNETIQAMGKAHIIAISGFNTTLLSGVLIRIFGRSLGKRRGAVASALGIAAYTALVGGGAAVVRAALSKLALLVLAVIVVLNLLPTRKSFSAAGASQSSEAKAQPVMCSGSF